MNSQAVVLNMATVPNQTDDQFQPALLATSSLETFQSTGLEIQQQSFNFDFDNQIFDDLITLPFSMDVGGFTNNHLSSNSNPEPSLSSVLDCFHTCVQGHNHLPWPRKGLVEIQKCERRCHFCGQELKTAAALRKHVYDHKKKDNFEIEIVPGKSGRQRRALIPENSFGALNHLLERADESYTTGSAHDPFSGVLESCPTKLSEAMTLARNLQRKIAGLKEEIAALRAEISRLERNERNREAQRRFRAKQKNNQCLSNPVDGNGITAPEATEIDKILGGTFRVPDENLDGSTSLPWGGVSIRHVEARRYEYRRSFKKREECNKFRLLAAFLSMRIFTRSG
ncbi:hypothetical protein F4678DRAFT_436148 [Xylaria arbuscula]|nr:hypothetical protein F4678DRAFT_436148 [Xylaria arbuscula]